MDPFLQQLFAQQAQQAQQPQQQPPKAQRGHPLQFSFGNPDDDEESANAYASAPYRYSGYAPYSHPAENPFSFGHPGQQSANPYFSFGRKYPAPYYQDDDEDEGQMVAAANDVDDDQPVDAENIKENVEEEDSDEDDGDDYQGYTINGFPINAFTTRSSPDNNVIYFTKPSSKPKSKPKPKPTPFSFLQSQDPSEYSNSPNPFSLGSYPAKKPAFTFGSNRQPKSPFQFGSTRPEKSPFNFDSHPTHPKSVFHFGSPAPPSKSVFNFGSNPKPSESAFHFGDDAAAAAAAAATEAKPNPFIFGPKAAVPNKRQRQQNPQQMYIMDRFGNLYPYQDTVTSPKPRREIDANKLIKLLLGGDANEEDTLSEDHDKQATTGEGKDHDKLQEAAVAKALEDEEKAENKYATERENDKDVSEKEKPSGIVQETPLTREGLADLLSQLAAKEIEEEKEEEAKRAKVAESMPTAAPIPAVIPPPVAVPQMGAPPVQQKVRRQSTVPTLNVHKADKNEDDKDKESAGNEKVTVVSDVKVSAPQLKKSLPFSPPLNVYEFKSQYIVVISLPGVSKEFVQIDYHPTNNELVIKGELKNKYLSDDDASDEANKFILKVSEQRFGNFERIVKLPAYPGIEDSKIKARFLNGMLEIKVPKVDESKLQKEAKKIALEEVPDEELQRESSEGYI